MQHWQVWASVLARIVATGLALVGLAGIGLAARGSPELGGLMSASPVAGLARLAGVSAATAPGPRATTPAPAPALVPPTPLPCVPQPAAAVAAAEAATAASAPATPAAALAALEPRVAAPGRGRSSAPSAEGRIVLNLAGAAELQRLPGIGAKRAAAILELRQRLGRFKRPADLLRIKGIGPRTLERMLPLLVLDAPAGGG